MQLIFDSTEMEYFPVRFRAPRRRLDRWITVLNSKGISNKTEKDSFGWFLLVPENMVAAAELEIELYEKENIPPPPEPEKLVFTVNKALFLIVPILLVAFHLYAGYTDHPYNWLDHGRTSAELIVKGEWWRAVTALTLHGDIKHVLSNAVLGSIIIYGLARLIGPGMAWTLTLFSGFAGNMLNAYFYELFHNSIGASTAVFGAIGVIGAIQFFSKFRYRRIKAWVPFAAALGLLAALGSSETTDIMAHFFGFASGTFAGFVFGFLFRGIELPGKFTQAAASFFALAIIIISWGISFGF